MATDPRTVTFDLSDADTLHVLTQALDDYQVRQRDLAADGDNPGKRIEWAAVARRLRDAAEAAAG